MFVLFCSCFASTNILSILLFWVFAVLSIAATNTDRKTNLGFPDKPQRENKLVFAGNKHLGTWRTWCGYPSTMVPLCPSAKIRNSECQPATTTTPVNAKTEPTANRDWACHDELAREERNEPTIALEPELPRESDWVCELAKLCSSGCVCGFTSVLQALDSILAFWHFSSSLAPHSLSSTGVWQSSDSTGLPHSCGSNLVSQCPASTLIFHSSGFASSLHLSGSTLVLCRTSFALDFQAPRLHLSLASLRLRLQGL